ncbi:MAG: adenylate/guanylate cyclase domain-containing protein [Acidimicrobiia bacterium]|nr:adenylate/guanylate cyclase domain-containing protein [Acidimicrobiia bacterium]
MIADSGFVVFTDLVGFTQFTAERGDELALALLERQDRIVRDALPAGARIVKELGDGLLLWFSGETPVLGTCLALQTRFSCESSDDAPLWVRMGVHWGCPRRRGDDLVGHDVNLASRIADVAAPGEVLLSEAARAHTAEGDVAFEELGPVFVRGVRDPVRLFRAVGSDSGTSSR